MVNGAVSPTTKRPGREAGHLPIYGTSFEPPLLQPPPHKKKTALKAMALNRCGKNLQPTSTAAVLDNSVNIHQWFLNPIF
jgi:hypothetical protein